MESPLKNKKAKVIAFWKYNMHPISGVVNGEVLDRQFLTAKNKAKTNYFERKSSLL